MKTNPEHRNVSNVEIQKCCNMRMEVKGYCAMVVKPWLLSFKCAGMDIMILQCKKCGKVVESSSFKELS